jgi:hypothetical protein
MKILSIAAAALLMTVRMDATVIYTLSVLDNVVNSGVDSFQYNAPDFVAFDTSIPVSALDYCTFRPLVRDACLSVSILPSGPNSGDQHPEILIRGTSTGESAFYFPYGSFSLPGSYAPIFGSGTLTVSAVLEPPSAALLYLGVLSISLWHLRLRRLATNGGSRSL